MWCLLVEQFYHWDGINVIKSIERPIQLYCDNQPAIFFAKNKKRSDDIKHINVKYLLVREKVKEWQTRVDYISTDDMLVDPLRINV